jgi:hypothetical protein
MEWGLKIRKLITSLLCCLDMTLKMDPDGLCIDALGHRLSLDLPRVERSLLLFQQCHTFTENTNVTMLLDGTHLSLEQCPLT